MKIVAKKKYFLLEMFFRLKKSLSRWWLFEDKIRKIVRRVRNFCFLNFFLEHRWGWVRVCMKFNRCLSIYSRFQSLSDVFNFKSNMKNIHSLVGLLSCAKQKHFSSNRCFVLFFWSAIKKFIKNLFLATWEKKDENQFCEKKLLNKTSLWYLYFKKE